MAKGINMRCSSSQREAMMEVTTTKRVEGTKDEEVLLPRTLCELMLQRDRGHQESNHGDAQSLPESRCWSRKRGRKKNSGPSNLLPVTHWLNPT